MQADISFLDQTHFSILRPKAYGGGWLLSDREQPVGYIWDDRYAGDHGGEPAWSAEMEDIHEEPTRGGWIDVYERQQVKQTMGKVLRRRTGQTVVEFGASVGYMIAEIRDAFPQQRYVATDIMSDGLEKSYRRNKEIYHIQCDFTDAPFLDGSVDVVYGLNVLEHISADEKAIAECFRVLKKGGWCLFVVPRGETLYDYFDETLFHKRRYARGELKAKVEAAGFQVVKDVHLAWCCYPVFWLKKKLNRLVGRRLSPEEKVQRVKGDIKTAMASPLAIGMIRAEEKLSRFVRPPFGVRELILGRKV